MRTIPVSIHDEQVRIFHAYALTDKDKIAYSKPVIFDSQAGAAPRTASATVVSASATVPVKLVKRNGIFDDFVDDSTEASLNPTGADIVTANLPVSSVPYFLLDCDEGAGPTLNDGGIGQQLGRAWVDGPVSWIAQGYRGSALKLAPNSVLNVRSKSWPYGSVTASARVHVDASTLSESETPVTPSTTFRLGAFTASITRKGSVKVTQAFTGLTANCTNAYFQPGWNHMVFVYDFSSISVYLNGNFIGKSDAGGPVQQRTHWAPQISIGPDAGRPSLLDGGIDQIEVIGTALDANAVKLLYTRGQWKPTN